nr:hypothetical protein [Rhodococcus sp. (in: high G+C Gram-positive bacteria)]
MTEPRNNRRSSDYTEAEKRALIGPGLTLNGVEARADGCRNDFATVTRRGDHLSAEFAWSIIENARTNNTDLRS